MAFLITAPLTNVTVAADSLTTLPPVIVTANRIAEAETQVLAAVTVIERADIERQQAHSLSDVLRGVPGITIAQSGGDGHPLSVYLRGTNADHVLVLIDGVKVGSATLGTAPLHNLPVDQIERIEIVRGPRSSLYGSEAIGGVIQIFTKRGGGKLTPTVSISGGDLATRGAAVGISGGGDHGWFNFSANVKRTDGINACDGQPSPFAGCGVNEPDRDGYRNVGVNLRAGYRFNPAVQFDVHLLQSDNESEFDGSAFAGNRARATQQVVGTTVTLKPRDWWTVLLSAGHSWDQHRSFFADPAAGVAEHLNNRYETERDTLSLQHTVTLRADQQLTVGVDYLNDQVASTVNYAQDSRHNVGLFSAYHGQFGATDLTVSGRQDDNQQFGSHATGNAAVGYRFDNGVHVDLSYGTAFKAPSFNDLYFPNYGTATLKPEQSRSWELGISGALPLPPLLAKGGGGDFSTAAGRWEARLFRTDIDDLIVYDAASWSAANLASARIHGLETTAAARLFDLDLRASVTLLQPENRADVADQDGNLLPRRPEQTLQLDADRQFGRWSAGATLFAAGRRFDDVANTTRLDGYTLLHLRTEYALTKAVTLQARLDNVFDENYETAYLFNQPGRTVFFTMRYAPTSGD
ncbi:TonB-dependent receptor [Rhodoferax sp. 4810]|uniref:TonB-dependent receptor n=2 Tax=Thiospirillum jenense TaxID=1653858 RepID=A0A839HBN0_9GAMM|nr:TonB-dependent receptor [Rhodoferax jenense]MBB1126101.1 TonB-dependent receptor [Thiospirillum jenense]